MKLVKGLLYSKDHEWVKVENDKAYIGITDYAQHQLGDVVFVELPEIDDEFSQGESLGAIESVKAASDMLMPVSGKVIGVNEALEDEPSLVNDDAFENWIIEVEITDNSELDKLMSAEEYEKYCEEV